MIFRFPKKKKRCWNVFFFFFLCKLSRGCRSCEQLFRQQCLHQLTLMPASFFLWHQHSTRCVQIHQLHFFQSLFCK
uniref:Putative secreted protein n=1 Tax=Ixodes scapularis TaxID=6945 RepID=A0A4D5RE67_IXOSC